MPDLYIIAGPNGAGKTTASMTILPDVLFIKEFINADAIAAGISPFNVEDVAFQAARIMLERIDLMIAEQKDFAIETTLSSKSYIKLVDDAKARGYSITLIFFWLKDVELAQLRVKNRVLHGGHNIPETVIERRYHRGIYNLINHFIHLCDVWAVFDNSFLQPKMVAKGIKDTEIEIMDANIFDQLKANAK
jgi:predicted ABC-type ATPase